MDRTTSESRRQGGPVKGARPDLAYAQIPLILLRLPTGERAAAIEVWATLHQHLRLGSSKQKISDETLSQSPYLEGRSLEHARKGLEILERLGLIARTAKGSSRRVALLGRIKGTRNGGATSARGKIGSPQQVTTPTRNKTATTCAPLRVAPETDATAKRFFPNLCTKYLVQGN